MTNFVNKEPRKAGTSGIIQPNGGFVSTTVQPVPMAVVGTNIFKLSVDKQPPSFLSRISASLSYN